MKPSEQFPAVDLSLARTVLETEASAVRAIVDQLDEQFSLAIKILCECQGRVIVTGMGKSGIICRKIAATLSSTGTPAFFLNPAEAIHGDLGVIQSTDVVLALSYSGTTDEILRLLETIRRLKACLIAMTGTPDSALALAADATLTFQVNEEACPMNLAPTASTTAALALGDALAMTLLVTKGFRPEDFANLHPGGTLGKRLIPVERLMHLGKKVPIVQNSTKMKEVIHEISSKGLGMSCVVNNAGKVVGLITDGDLRRHLSNSSDILSQTAEDVMTKDPRTVSPKTLAVQALNIMEQHRITSLIVVSSGDQLEGVLHLHDLWRTELF